MYRTVGLKYNRFLLTFFLFQAFSFGQSVSISIGSGSGTPGSTVSLPVTLSSAGGALPAGLQWTFSLPSNITGLSVATGSAATAAGKTVTCNGPICIVFGENNNTITNGTVATATFTLASALTQTQTPTQVQLTGAVASTAAGAQIAATGGS